MDKMNKYIFHSNALSDEQLTLIQAVFNQSPKLADGFYFLESVESVELSAIRQQLSVDVNVLDAGFKSDQVRLLVTDMDSTLISIECIDEIADMQGIKAQVSAITEAAMR
ncbi:MAG: phosphoserine phosphatase, partial [Cycloclasticus sp.]